MFISLVFSFPYPSLWEMVAIFLTISALWFALRSLVAVCPIRPQNPEPTIQHGEETSSMASPYLACSSDDEELIGGSPLHLAPPKGPAGTSLTFRVFTPPSLDREIPKVDMYGAINFVRTGKIRTFAPTGARRLLVIDIREMTLAVYVSRRASQDKPNQFRKVIQKQNSSTSGRLFFSNNGHGATETISPVGGINISTKAVMSFGLNELDPDSEDGWSSRNFEPTPTFVHRFDDLVSVAAVPPRHGGVIEIISRVGIPCQNSFHGGDLFGDSERNNVRKTRQRNRGLNVREEDYDGSSTSTTGILPNTVPPKRGDRIAGNIDGINNQSPGDRRDEYIFQSPRDAAEFQRIILVLRTAGREIASLYETLEAIQATIVAPLETKRSNETTRTPASHGVSIDDAWCCMNEIPVFREGLYRFHHSSKSKKHVDDVNELNKSETAEHLGHMHKNVRPPLGLLDFLCLFAPPLPMMDSHAIPSLMPCANSECMLGSDPELKLTTGIEWHYQHLCFALALQRRVSNAALCLRVYSWARIVCAPKLDDADERDIINSSAADALSNSNEYQEGNRDNSERHGEAVNCHGKIVSLSGHGNSELFRSCEKNSRSINDGEDADASVSVHGNISNPSNSHHQGYSCVGWFVFENPSEEEEPHNIPCIQAVLNKYPYAHFFVSSYFIEGTTVAMYFLHVRSLPVGVDRVFDDTMNNLDCSCTRERDSQLGISFQIGAANASSLLTKVAFRLVITALCHEVTRRALGWHTLKDRGGQMTLLSDFFSSNLAPLGGLIERRQNFPSNCIAINYQFCQRKFPTRMGRVLLRIIRVFIEKINVVDFTCVLNASPQRAITSIRMENIDLRCLPTPIFKEVPKASEGIRFCTDAAQHNDRYDELFCKKVNTIHDLLDSMAIPVRIGCQTRGEHNPDNQGEIITVQRICSRLVRSDIERFLIACECNLRAAVVRIIESVAWRGIMYPIDTRSCRVEMQSGQFFQQGHDKEMNPIFYYRNNLLGPWRGNIHATIQSLLYRLETYILKVEHQRPCVKITLIALMGHPLENDGGECEQSACSPNQCSTSSFHSDPRIDPYEKYHSHSNILLMQLLNEVIPRHYPERLAKALVVLEKGGTKEHSRSHYHSQYAAPLVTVLSSESDLKKYVDEDELVKFAGGNAQVTSDAFHCIGSCDNVGI